ncbi:hypothetical protein V6N13_127747 [Hibiscus sabdariffa]
MEDDDSMFTPKAYYFFKIVLESTIRNKKLGIPKKFLRKYGNELTSSVLLTVPSGDTWHVELTNSDGAVWLQNGWQEFSEFYSLKMGHFLVFKYEGNGKFLVLIFDTSASEIKYPCKETRKKIPGASYSKPWKKPETSKKDKNKKECEDLSSDEEDLQSEVSGDELAFGASELYAKALLRASAFKSENPFFIVTMQPSYIEVRRNCGPKMCIPKDFTLKFLTEKTGDLTLCNSDGKIWYARYHRYITGHKYTRAIINIGWKPFMQDNNLKAGDVCVFELISQTEIKLNVIIYRARQDASGSSPLDGGNVGSSAPESTESKHHSSKRSMTCNEKAIAMQRASNFKSKNPFFKVVMQHTYLTIRNSLNVPYKFVKSYLDKEKNEAVLQVADGRTWTVRLAINVVTGGQHKAEFYPLKTFAQDNNLEVGDVCVFELINHHENSFKVSIFSAARGATSSLSAQGDAKASQVASKTCLVPRIEAGDDFGNCSTSTKAPQAEFQDPASESIVHLEHQEEVMPIKLHLKTMSLHISRKYLTNGSGDVTLCILENGKTWLRRYLCEATETRGIDDVFASLR